MKPGTISDGKPVGISPRIGAPDMNRLMTVPMISAASAPGIKRPRDAGQKKITPSDTAPIASADRLGSMTAPGIAVSAGMVPPPVGSWPNKRETCSAIMMTPMPLMKPEITGYGTRRMYCPSFMKPKTICSRPASTTAPNTSAGSPDSDAKTPANTTTIGPVGPETCDPVPPNSDAKKPTKMAPQIPAMGPAPDASPKARASGSATTPAVRPP